MDYKKAASYWEEKDKNNKVLEKEKLLPLIEAFIKKHNTFAIATGTGAFVRCTPVEYNYYDGAFYIFTEGGLKFVGLEKNANVSCAIFEEYKGFGDIHSLQITGTASIIEKDNPEFRWAVEKKGMNWNALEKMGMPFHLLKISARRYDFLESSLKKEGYSNRQFIEF